MNLKELALEMGQAWLKHKYDDSEDFLSMKRRNIHLRPTSRGFAIEHKWYIHSDTQFRVDPATDGVVMILPKNSVYSGQRIWLSPEDAVKLADDLGQYESEHWGQNGDDFDYGVVHDVIDSLIKKYAKIII